MCSMFSLDYNYDLIRFTVLPVTHTKNTHLLRQTDFELFLLPQPGKAVPLPVYRFWFAIWFGGFIYFHFCLLVSFVLPRLSVSLSNKNLEAKFSQYFFFQPPDKNV